MSVGTLPRPVLLGVVGVVLVAVVFFVTRRPGETTSPAPAPSQAPAPAQSTNPTPTTPSQPGGKGGTPGSRGSRAEGTPGLPARVKRALDAHKVVVVLFWNRHGVDDRSVKRALDDLPRRKSVALFSDNVRDLSRYTRITAATSVTTTPSLVIVDREGQAEVVTGYVDRQTLGQYVRNALRR